MNNEEWVKFLNGAVSAAFAYSRLRPLREMAFWIFSLDAETANYSFHAKRKDVDNAGSSH
jgi:hypothetical protein